MASKFNIKKGDRVVVTTGREKGKDGEVIEVRRADSRVLVRGINMVKKHIRPSQASAGGIETREAPLHISNVSHIDPESGKPTRIGYDIKEDGSRTRIARRSGKPIDGAPASKKPASKAPASKAPASKKPASKAPVSKAPASKAPASKKPASKKPASKKPASKVKSTDKSK